MARKMTPNGNWRGMRSGMPSTPPQMPQVAPAPAPPDIEALLSMLPPEQADAFRKQYAQYAPPEAPQFQPMNMQPQGALEGMAQSLGPHPFNMPQGYMRGGNGGAFLTELASGFGNALTARGASSYNTRINKQAADQLAQKSAYDASAAENRGARSSMIGQLTGMAGRPTPAADEKPTVDPGDAAMIKDAVGNKIVTPAAGASLGSGMTRQERKELRMKGMPGAATSLSGQAAGNLTPDAIDMAARAYLATGKLEGFGMAGGGARNLVRNRAAVISKTEGGGDVAYNQAEYKANSASLTNTTKMYDATAAFEGTAKKNADVLRPYIKNLTDIGSEALNMPIREWEKKYVGKPGMGGYITALKTVSNEYSRLLTASPNMTGELSDAARKEGEALLSKNMTIGHLVEALDVLDQDATNRLTSYKGQMDEIGARIGQKKPAGGDNMVKMYDKDGKPMLIDKSEQADALKNGWRNR